MPASHRFESVCPRNLSNITRRVAGCQPIVPTGFPPDLHIGELPPKRAELRSAGWPRAAVPTWALPHGSFLETATRVVRPKPRKPKAADRSVRATQIRRATQETEEFKLEKRSLGGYCDERSTLRGTLSPNETPWPGLISEYLLCL